MVGRIIDYKAVAIVISYEDILAICRNTRNNPIVESYINWGFCICCCLEQSRDSCVNSRSCGLSNSYCCCNGFVSIVGVSKRYSSCASSRFAIDSTSKSNCSVAWSANCQPVFRTCSCNSTTFNRICYRISDAATRFIISNFISRSSNAWRNNATCYFLVKRQRNSTIWRTGITTPICIIINAQITSCIGVIRNQIIIRIQLKDFSITRTHSHIIIWTWGSSSVAI